MDRTKAALARFGNFLETLGLIACLTGIALGVLGILGVIPFQNWILNLMLGGSLVGMLGGKIEKRFTQKVDTNS